MVKNPPANSGDTVRSLGQEDPPGDEMATHSSILAWEIPWTEECGSPRGCTSWTRLPENEHDIKW